MSATATFTPRVVQLRADGDDLQALLEGMRELFGPSDYAYHHALAAHLRREPFRWDLDADDAEACAHAAAQAGLPDLAVQLRASALRARADQAREDAASFDAQAHELEAQAVA